MSAESNLRKADLQRAGKSRRVRAESDGSQAERALEELREVLTRPALDRMERMERKLAAGGVDAAAVASHLPRATAMMQGNQEFSRALAPTVEEAIQVSVRKNPKPLVDAIFPIIGPAIRRSIQTALAGMTEGMNASLESSFKLKGVRRWIQAKRTGRTVGEIALLESLIYRVEQVLWIENETGLLLANVSDPGLTIRDPDLVSSMLAALQDYVGDSFGDSVGGESGGERMQLQEIEFGEQQLAIFRGPRSSLAALVRGRASREWRNSAQELLERLHLAASEELAEFDGDVDPFQSWTGELETVLEERERERKRSYTTQILLVAVVAFGLFGAVRAFNLRREAQKSWSRVAERFEDEPGVLILNREVEGKILQLDLLCDPLARPADEILADLREEDRGRVATRVIPHLSLDLTIALRRAQADLNPPATVNLTMDGRKLVASGEASHRWLSRAAQRVALVQGIEAFDFRSVRDLDASDLASAIGRLHSERLPAQAEARNSATTRWTESLRELDLLAQTAAALVRVSVVGPLEEAEEIARALTSSESKRVFIHAALDSSQASSSLQIETTPLDNLVLVSEGLGGEGSRGTDAE